MWATANDVLERWIGDDKPTDHELVQRWVDDAETLILSEFPDIQDRIDAGDLPVERVRFVVARMVTRAFRNPNGLRQVNEQAGPFGLSGTFAGSTPGDVMLTPEERALLRAPTKARRPRAFTVDPTPPAVESTPWWVT